jgi:hypothetical protein
MGYDRASSIRRLRLKYRREMNFYLSILPSLLPNEEGKFALIKENKISVFSNFENAIEYGSHLREPYFIKQIEGQDLNMFPLPIIGTRTTSHDEIPFTILRLTELGNERLKEIARKEEIARNEIIAKTIKDRKRRAIRSWKVVFNEARMDISEDIWPFINWQQPDNFSDDTKIHKFSIVVPGYLEFFAVYRCLGYLDWHWHSWVYGEKPVYTFKDIEDLALVFASTNTLKRKSKVEIKEISNGKLEEDTPNRQDCLPVYDSIYKNNGRSLLKAIEPNLLMQA